MHSPHVLDFVAADYVFEVVSLEELVRDVRAELAADAPLARGPGSRKPSSDTVMICQVLNDHMASFS